MLSLGDAHTKKGKEVSMLVVLSQLIRPTPSLPLSLSLSVDAYLSVQLAAFVWRQLFLFCFYRLQKLMLLH